MCESIHASAVDAHEVVPGSLEELAVDQIARTAKSAAAAPPGDHTPTHEERYACAPVAGTGESGRSSTRIARDFSRPRWMKPFAFEA
jgi:hypothetical protein